MRLSVITPPALYYYAGATDYHLIPAHHFQWENDLGAQIRSFYRFLAQRGDYIILDNGVTELGRAMPTEDLFYTARMMQVNEVVLPDVFDDAEGTIESTLTALEVLDKEVGPWHPRFMAVVHGKTWEEWEHCYRVFMEEPRIRTIGLPKVMTRNFGDRVYALRRVARMPRLSGKEYHCLGVWDDPFEILKLADEHPWIRGIDTSYPVMSGVNGVPIDSRAGTQKFQLDEEVTEDSYPEVTLRNISVAIAWAGYTGKEGERGEKTTD